MESTPNKLPPFSPKFAALIEDVRLRECKDLLAYWQSVALRCGGLEELDYRREPGVSFNPRPSRVAHILTSDCGLWEAVSLCAAMLAVLQERVPTDFLCFARQAVPLDQEVLELAAAAAQAFQTPQAASRTAQLIVLSCHLDRIRHFHLSPAVRREQIHASLLHQTQQFLELAKRERLPLERQFAHWIRRQNKG